MAEKWMNQRNGRKQGFVKNGLLFKTTLMTTVLMLTISAAAMLIIFQMSYKVLNDEIQNNLAMSASVAATSIDVKGVERVLSSANESSRDYVEVQKDLQSIKNSGADKLRYVYILSKKENKYAYLVDAELESDLHNHSFLGEPFLAEDYTYVEKAFATGTAMAEKSPTQDDFGGMTQTGYAPLIDEQGKVVAVLAVDMDVSVLVQKKAEMNAAGTGALFLAFLLALLAGIAVSFYLTKPILRLSEGIRHVAAGDLNARIQIDRNDEFGQLAEAFNEMACQLEIMKRELEEYSIRGIHQEKMAGIGQLSAGIAHEINNPLGYVVSDLDILKKRMDVFVGFYQLIQTLDAKTDMHGDMATIQAYIQEHEMEQSLNEIREILDESEEGLGRIGNIVKSLLGFSKQAEKEEFALYDLIQGVRDTLEIAKNEIRFDATVTEEFHDIPAVVANDGEINQALMNVLFNAVAAIREKGVAGTITIRTYLEAGYVCCEIEDNGVGIPDENLNRIFDPFFTTRPVGSGTGLGLSVVHDVVVMKHCGAVEVTSEVGKGTIVKIKLPISREFD